MKSVLGVLKVGRKSALQPARPADEKQAPGGTTEPPLEGVTNARQCVEWLANLPLTNTHQVAQAIAALIETLDAAAVSPLQQLEILETLRHTLVFVQDENAAKYRLKPLPFGAPERAMFEHVTGLWQMMHQAYANALHAASDAAGETHPHFALICQRVIAHTALTMREFVLARQEIARDLWRQLHTYFEIAHMSGVAGTRVGRGSRPTEASRGRLSE